MFLHNSWYPVMWSEALPRGTMQARRVLDTPLVFFRTADGRPSALFDMCPHRQVPLHLGRLVDGARLQCGYHGLEFSSEGVCVANPHGGAIPDVMRVRAYPVIERHTIVWAWMGEQPPDSQLIPDFGLMDEAPDGLSRDRSHLHIAANYLLVAENLLDLSHANYLHDGLLGLPEHSNAKVTVEQAGHTVTCKRFMPDVPVARLHDLLFKRDGQRIDMGNEVRWDAPASLVLTHRFSRPGGADATEFRTVHLLVPETETSTHYSYGIVRTPAPQEKEVETAVADMRRFAFENQDRVMLEAQQAMHRAYPAAAAHPVLLSVDAAAVRMRRVLQQLMSRDSM